MTTSNDRRKARDAALWRCFNGRNYAQLARQFNLPEWAVRPAIERHIAATARPATQAPAQALGSWTVVATAVFEEAFADNMKKLIQGALGAVSEESHLEWLAAMQLLVGRRAAVMAIVGGQTGLCPQPPAQS